MATGGLDTRYVPLFTLQDVLVDKISGDELSGGIVSFYSDNSRNTPKQVYMLSGVAPNYTYTAIGTQLILSSVGTFVDGSGNDIVPYLFPYDGDASTTTDTLDLYYIVVQNSAGTQQFTREGVPNLASSSNSQNNDFRNLAPNSQFLLHNAHIPIPGSSTIVYGGVQGTMDVMIVAPGGWTYERTNGSSATDEITFTRNGNGNANIGNARYSINIDRTIAATDISKFALRFMDVNKFAGRECTLLFDAQLLSGTTLQNCNLYEINYFGTSNSTSGSPTPADTTYQVPDDSEGNPVAPFTITSTLTQFALNFVGSTHVGSAIGTDDNDFVQYAIVFPTNTPFNVQLSNFILVVGSALGGGQTIAPITNNGQYIIEAMDSLAQTTGNPTNSNPNYYPQDGSNLYLPVIMTKSGFSYDYSLIGRVEGSFNPNPVGNQLLCDGSIITAGDYSNLGIPYTRLQSVLYNSTYNGPIFGTGTTYSTAYINSGNTAEIVLATNQAGAETTPSNGTTSFTIGTLIAGQASIGYKAYANSNAIVTAISTFTNGTNGSAGVAAGTSGMTVSSTHLGLNEGYYYEFQIVALNAAALGNGAGVGKYFTFSDNTTNYVMWFHTATETAPVVAGTKIQVDLDLTMSAADVANVIANALSAHQVNTIVVGNGASISGGNFFTFTANSTNYNVWYKVSGSGSSPGGNAIEVDILSSDTADQVATKTQTAINSRYYALPDLRGMFLRGADVAGGWDIDYLKRFSFLNNLVSNNVGTFQLDQIYSHRHTIYPNFDTGAATPPSPTYFMNNTLTAESGMTGGTESRPVNAYVNWFIRY